jgi:DNA-binding IclR family transcriptional regulator
LARPKINKSAEGEGDPKAPRYRAPALDKGLDILELILRANQPMTTAMITQALKRSTSELFRMIQTLEYRGFIEQAPSGGFVPTSKLFSLGLEQAPVKTLLETALPVMRDLAHRTDQSCHLAVRSGGDITVVARMESGSQIGFTVRIGHRRPIMHSTSGGILFAFQPADVQARWVEQFGKVKKAEIDAFRADSQRYRDQGFAAVPSEVVQGVTDLSAPILRGEVAAAALTMTFVEKRPSIMSMQAAIPLLCEAAASISRELPEADHRV